jgi:ABC-type phosphate/phosphonate transport system substrate-binding protein
MADGVPTPRVGNEPPSISPARPATAAGLVLCALLAAAAAAQQAAPRGPVLRLGICSSLFVEVNPSDALASALVWSRGIAKEVAGYADATAVAIRDAEGAVASVNAGDVDVAALSTLEYLSVERRLKADPALVFDVAGRTMTEYVVLAPPGVKSPDELKGKRLAIYNAFGEKDLSLVWTEVWLGDSHLPPVPAMFSSIRVVTKKSQAALAVFFHQADVAIEDKAAFETAVELNPQLGRALSVLATSPPFLTGVVCINRALDPAVRQQLVRGGLTLHEHLNYRQSFLVMRVTRLTAYTPGHLATARDLIARQAALAAGRKGSR